MGRVVLLSLTAALNPTLVAASSLMMLLALGVIALGVARVLAGARVDEITERRRKRRAAKPDRRGPIRAPDIAELSDTPRFRWRAWAPIDRLRPYGDGIIPSG